MASEPHASPSEVEKPAASLPRWSRGALLVLILAALAALVLWPSAEAELARALRSTASQLSYSSAEPAAQRDQRFREVLNGWLTPQSQLEIAHGPVFVGPEQAAAGLSALTGARPQLLFELDRLELELGAEQGTGVGYLHSSASQVGDVHREQRRIDLTFIRTQTGWKLSRLKVGPIDQDEPWERP